MVTHFGIDLKVLVSCGGGSLAKKGEVFFSRTLDYWEIAINSIFVAVISEIIKTCFLLISFHTTLYKAQRYLTQRMQGRTTCMKTV